MNTNIHNPKFNKELPFIVPDGYFDSLPQKIQEKCTSQPEIKHTPWIVAIRSQLAFVAGFAALALIASLGYYFTKNLTSRQNFPSRSFEHVEIVSRDIYNDYDFEQYKATEGKRHEVDSLNEFTNGMFLRYYSPKNKFSSISEEKRDINSLP